MRLSNQPDNTPTSIYNPDKSDFTIAWNEEPYTIHAGEIETYPKWLADHIAKHLCKHLVMQRGIRVNYEEDYKEMMKQIVVEL